MSSETVHSSASADIRIGSTSISIFLRVQTHLVGKIALVSGSLFFFIPAVLLVSGGAIPFFPLLLFLIFWSLTFGRMLLWTFFGKEHITITQEHVEYQRSYGIVQTGVHKVVYQAPLVITPIHKREANGVQIGRMELTTTGETGRPVLILKTGVHLPQRQIDAITAAVQAWPAAVAPTASGM